MGDLGGFTNQESGTRATRPLSSKSSRRAALAGVSAGSKVPLNQLYTGKRVVEDQYF